VRLTRENTAIVLDSTSDFVDARDRHANMRLVPLYVLFDGEALRDQVDISPEEFYARLASAKALPTTSQPTPADFLAVYEELAATGFDRIWSLHLTAKLSGTFESAQRAAAQLGGDRVRLVDTETASLAVALLAEAIERPTRRSRRWSSGSRTKTASSSPSRRSSTCRRADGSARPRPSPARC
jgi:DegV family protein with EDD domain